MLLEDNQKDERLLRQLEKNLKMKKRKSTSLPRAFVNDGLDCIFSCLAAAVQTSVDQLMVLSGVHIVYKISFVITCFNYFVFCG